MICENEKKQPDEKQNDFAMKHEKPSILSKP